MGLTFTDTAHTAMAEAREEAARLNHAVLGTEHLLLGIISAGGDGIKRLAALGVDPESICQEIEKQFPAKAKKASNNQLTQSPLIKKVIAQASNEAAMQEDDRVGTAQLLLGILAQKDSGAVRVLKTMGADFSGATAHI